ncbi:MAG: hypothetical protein WDZ88_02870 [Candidatus Paceibacterota bacterium]
MFRVVRKQKKYAGRLVMKAGVFLLLLTIIFSDIALVVQIPWSNIKRAEAAPVLINNSLTTSDASSLNTSPTTVFVNDTKGYTFFVDSSNACVYASTTDAGATWSSPYVVDGINTSDCIRVNVWYDRWTPGNTTGEIIHISTIDTGDDDIFYTELDTSDDTISTTVVATTQSGTFAAGTNFHSVTRASDGDIYMAVNDASDSWIVSCSGTCTNAGNWSEITNPHDLQNDWNILLPLLSGEIMSIRYDVSDNDYDYQIWNGTSWSGSWVTIDTSSGENTTYDAHYGATVDVRTGDVYMSYITDNGTLGTDDDIRVAVYDYNTGSWTQKTNVLTNDSKGLTDTKIAINQHSNKLYVVYTGMTNTGDTTTGNVYYKTSDNGGDTWSSEVQVNSSASDLYGGANTTIIGDERIYTTWTDGAANSLYGETIEDISPPVIDLYAYRWFESATSTSPGSPLALSNTLATSTERGTPFRLRTLLNIDDSSIASSSLDFKLQYAEKSGSCDAGFSGESYSDVLTGSGPVRFYDNTGIEDGLQATTNAGDPTPSGSGISYQSYLESGDFTNTYGAIATNMDGLWDFSLIDVSSPEETSYCFRIVYSDDSLLDTYSKIPEIITPSRPPIVTQSHFHFRDDDGNELNATSLTGGAEDIHVFGIQPTTTIRLRFGIDNTGVTTSPEISFRLEYAEKGASCDTSVGWTDVGAVGGDWDMSDSTFLTDGDDTTDIALSIGGVTNSESVFLTPNGGIRDTNSQTGALAIDVNEYTELEYAIEAFEGVVEGTTYCFRVTDAGGEIDVYSVYPEATIAASVLVSSIGTQVEGIDIPDTNRYVGGAFVIQDNIGTHSVTEITISEQGTVDAQNNLENIKLYYDLDTSAPYSCSSESYTGGEAQFGSTASGFSGANGSTTFNGSVGISTTTAMCVYVVLDAKDEITDGETLEIEITDPSSDIVISDNPTISPGTAVALEGTTGFNDDFLVQTGYHWRNDDGSESGATSATGGVEGVTLNGLRKTDTTRLRLQVANEGGTTTPDTVLRLEYGTKITTCSAVSGWTDVGAVGGDWDMSDSTFLTDGDDTTDIALSIGGVTNSASTFTTPNGSVKDTSSQISPIKIANDAFLELEFSFSPTASSTAEATYCFRISDSGTELPQYDIYAEVTLAPNQDFFIQRGFEQINGTSTTLYAGVDYVAPNESTNAFIRITNTHYTGAGDSTDGGTQNADDVTVHILDPENIETSVTFVRPEAAVEDTHVAWEIIEYQGFTGASNELVVREQGVIQITGANLFATTSEISGVQNDEDVVVFITGVSTPDTGVGDYNLIQAISSWNATTSSAVFERGEGGDTISISYAVVEFTGRHWNIQRIEHQYSSAGTTETETIPTSVNSISRTFLHTQKLAGTNEYGVDEFGHTVWLSSVSEVSFELQTGVTTPNLHRSVAWVIENTQTNGTPMNVVRSNGTQTGGSEPSTIDILIGATLSRLDTASIFINSRSSGTGSSYPHPIIATYLISTTEYRFWISDTNNVRTYRTEVVEWPTAPRKLTQNYYRIYVNTDALTPSDPWPAGGDDLGENTTLSLNDIPVDTGDVLRLRMSVLVDQGNMPANYQSFKLQFGERTSTCSAITEWSDIGSVSSTTALWRGYNNASVTDGTTLSVNPPNPGDLLLSVSDRAGSYEESNNSANNAYPLTAGEDIEYDWVIENNDAGELTPYCFRMVEADTTALDEYAYYPTVFTAGYEAVTENWRWYGDAENETPSDGLSTENSAPTGIAYGATVALRVTLTEIAGKVGQNLKLRLEYDESSSFTNPQFVTNDAECTEGLSLWCYGDGGGVDNATITTATLSDADSCVAGVGNGCGTHNELATSTSEFDHQVEASTEFSFILRHAGARANTVYFFRVYDVTNDRYVVASSTYPSVVTEGAGLTFTLSGVSSGSTIDGITTDNSTTANNITFGDLIFNEVKEVAQRIIVTTNATEGYQVFMYARQGLLRGDTEIEPILHTNALPGSFETGCDTDAITGCFGYHTGDDTLAEGSVRFAADDTYARFSQNPEEIIYSSSPVNNETTDIVFKAWVNENQVGGLYESSIVYIVVPVF